MAKKKKKAKAPRGDTWVGYFPRVVKDKTKYNRKKEKQNLRRDNSEI